MPVTPTPSAEVAFIDDLFTTMTDAEKDALEKKKAALDKLLAPESIGRYKIEILLGKDFAPSKPSAGAMSFWESGNKLHGGGDSILYFCPGRRLKRNDCEAAIPEGSFSNDVNEDLLICPKCFSKWEAVEVVGQICARLDYKGWAALVLKYYLRLDMRADIYVKYHPEDIRSAAHKEQQKQRMGEDLERVRNKRAVRIYPLANIIKDTSAGADLEGRFQAFLRA